MTAPALNLWLGQTAHARYVPFERRFAYKLALIDIDIDRLDEAGAQSALFAVDAPGLFSFHRRDHGARADVPLRRWAEETLASAGVYLAGGAIRLVTFPRHMFYKFAPISLWYGYGPDGALRGIIYEVNNTFGETHSYVAAVTSDRSQHEAGKAFHVSPFFDVTGAYRFTLRAPSDRLGVVVESLKDGQRLHMANITARRRPATTSAFLRIALTAPFSTLGVALAIHWQAAKIWLRGAKYRSKPAPPEPCATIAVESKRDIPHVEKDAA
ncbi:DUF1365 domain-containing protein [Hyphomonas johnsonii]|uniref:DUF1365 domain-containing protein n=1 Tax=Hyphomonas johnsonii MHS-2 TaxID=1280950 RepID=A0A059FVB3_9PROT|nr:DUF1365 domain-containing protein [Hyphomonas johnsonii]KCZ94398.1 hypothetical protein HJO_03450 [Hyphomonas johnsonii MHS-2]